MSSLGGSGLLVGLLFAVAATFELPSMRFSGAMAARIGPGEALLLACAVLRGLGYGLFYVGTIRFLNERAPAEWSATVQGIMNATAYGLGQLITRPLGGRVFDVFGPRVLYLLCATLISMAAVIMAVMVRAGRSNRAPNLELIAGHRSPDRERVERTKANRL
jgi:MFS family permease